VTEAVCGLDLVHLMIDIAGNNRLDVTQERVRGGDRLAGPGGGGAEGGGRLRGWGVRGCEVGVVCWKSLAPFAMLLGRAAAVMLYQYPGESYMCIVRPETVCCVL